MQLDINYRDEYIQSFVIICGGNFISRVARLPKIQYGKVMESYGNLKKIWKSYGNLKKNMEKLWNFEKIGKKYGNLKKECGNMENAQKALKYAIKSFYFLKKYVFYTPKSSLCNEAQV